MKGTKQEVILTGMLSSLSFSMPSKISTVWPNKTLFSWLAAETANCLNKCTKQATKILSILTLAPQSLNKWGNFLPEWSGWSWMPLKWLLKVINSTLLSIRERWMHLSQEGIFLQPSSSSNNAWGWPKKRAIWFRSLMALLKAVRKFFNPHYLSIPLTITLHMWT